jgi:hypothetical protein
MGWHHDQEAGPDRICRAFFPLHVAVREVPDLLPRAAVRIARLPMFEGFRPVLVTSAKLAL